LNIQWRIVVCIQRNDVLIIPLPLIELNLLLPQYLVELKGMLSTCFMSRPLIEVLLPSSLGFVPLCVEVSADLSKGLLGNPRLLFLHGEGLLPSRELCLTREKQFLQLLDNTRFCGRPSLLQECLSNESGDGEERHCYSCAEKTMEGPGERVDARYSATYTIRKVKQRLFINHAQDRVWQAKDRERSVTTGNQRYPQ
jgi:hypothetical protein